jgi:pre-rRNA-processing protein IPI3
LSLQGKSHDDEPVPIRPVMPFGRTRDLKGKPREVSLLLPLRSVCRFFPVLFDVDLLQSACQITYDPLEDYAYFSSPSVKQSPEHTEAKIDSLENEVKILREQLGKAKSINDAMWDTILQNAVAETKAGT